MRRIRDPVLLDAVDACLRESFDGVVWRIVREGRDPLLASRAGGRWFFPDTFDVLYASFEADGAKAEVFFHLNQQPVFPSKLVSKLYRLEVRTKKTLRFADIRALQPLGIDLNRFADVLYSPTQAIGDAAFFLGCDGIIVPSARWDCLNLVLFTEHLEPGNLRAQKTQTVDWQTFRAKTKHAGR
ncbi:MAG: RES family NAD+ phosphorylase [Verrucomicrobia bacterium]|nr:RES family NAD+ phosphorylase [Verrucomicrobiota bacterium]